MKMTCFKWDGTETRYPGNQKPTRPGKEVSESMQHAQDIPAEFWDKIPFADAQRIIRTGKLNAEECALVWRMVDRNDEPPQEMTVLVREARK